MNLYQMEHLTQQFYGKTVLDIEHLAIEAGSIHALIGPNGAGKTTLLNILAFLESPASGTLVFQGTTVDPAGSDMLSLRRRVVLVDQHPIMFSTTVRNNIEFGLKIRKVDAGKRQRIVDEVLATVDLERYAEARAHQLSGGETQRLALARALALDPEVLLCDEPTASVDVENQAVICELLRRINHERGTTVIFTTHDRLQAATLANNTLVLANGRLTNTTYENSYACTVGPGNEDRQRYLLHGVLELSFPARTSELDCTTSGRISIDPEKIGLFPATQPCPEHHAQLRGRVVMIMEEGRHVRVVVDVGVLMAVLMQGGDYHRYPPRIGGEVCLAVPEDACLLTI